MQQIRKPEQKKFILLTPLVWLLYKKWPSKKAEHTTTNHTSFFLTPITVEEVLQQYGFHSSGFRFLTLVVPRRPNHDEVPEITRSKVVGVGWKFMCYSLLSYLLIIIARSDEIQCKTIQNYSYIYIFLL